MKNLLLICLIALTANLMGEVDRCGCNKPRPTPRPAPAPVPTPSAKPELCDPNIQDCTGTKRDVEATEQNQVGVCDPAIEVCEEKRDVEQLSTIVEDAVEIVEVLDAVIAQLEAQQECVPGGVVECRRALAEGQEMVCCSDMVCAMTTVMKMMDEQEVERAPREENEPLVVGPGYSDVNSPVVAVE